LVDGMTTVRERMTVIGSMVPFVLVSVARGAG